MQAGATATRAMTQRQQSCVALALTGVAAGASRMTAAPYCIRDDQARCRAGRISVGKLPVDREQQAVAILAIGRPLRIGPKVRDARFDLDDPDVALASVSAAISARRPFGNGNSVMLARPNDHRCRRTPRAIASAAGDCRRSSTVPTIGVSNDVKAARAVRIVSVINELWRSWSVGSTMANRARRCNLSIRPSRRRCGSDRRC